MHADGDGTPSLPGGAQLVATEPAVAVNCAPPDRRQDGGSPYRGAHYGEPPSRRLFVEVARDGADSVNCCFETLHHKEVMLKFAP